MCSSYLPEDNPTSLWKIDFAINTNELSPLAYILMGKSILDGRKIISADATEQRTLCINLKYGPQKVLLQSKIHVIFYNDLKIGYWELWKYGS